MFETKISKILLGTVQFGMPYGIMNRYGQVPAKEVEDILTTAFNSGIHSLDTSGDYGDSEQIIGTIIKNNPTLKFDIYSKNATDDIEYSFNESFNRLNSIYGYSIHYFKTYNDNPSVWDEMRKLKDCGKVKKVGMSIYSPRELEVLLDKGIELDIIQVPSNILDRRFNSYFEELRKKGVEIHIRSVFLQGLFFKDMDAIPASLEAMKKPITEVQDYCLKRGIAIQDFALNYILSNNLVC